MRSLISPVFALLISTLFMQIGGGMSGYLLPIRAAEEGWATLNISLFAAGFALAFTLGCIVVPKLVMKIGHVRVFSALTASMAIALLLHALIVDPIAWVIFRSLSGFALSGTYMVLESWLNEKSTNESRGKVFSIYMLMTTCGIMIGQFSVPLGDILDTSLFIVCALAFLAALLPTTLSTASSPKPLASTKFNLTALIARSPISVLTAVMCGFITASWGTLAPVYVTLRGLSTTEGATMLGMAMLGGAVGQYPLGLLSDKIDRRLVMILISVIGLAACLTAYSIGVDNRYIFFTCVLLLGIGIFPLYSIAIAHANDFSDGDDFVETSSGLLIVYGGGTVIGPLIAAWILNLIGPEGLFASLAGAFLVVIIYAAYRVSQRETPPEDERTDYAATPLGRSISPQVFELDPRSDPEWGQGDEEEDDGETENMWN